MRNRFFVISAARSKESSLKSIKPVKRNRAEPNLDVLKKSPCLECELYVKDTVCPYVKGCSKIDEFQQVAAVHCTLFKDHDVFSILKI